MNTFKKYKFLLIYLLFTTILLISSFHYLYNIRNLSGNIIRSDGLGYYSYLPAYFKYKDLSFSFIDDDIGAIYSDKYGNIINKYPVGTAIMEFPFYFVADIICNVSMKYEADGFSAPYQYAIYASACIYLLLGLFILYFILKKFFSDKVVQWTMVLICFGTSLFHYASFDACYSHVFSFFLITTFIFLTIKSEENGAGSWWHFFILGIIIGLIFCVRNPNIVIIFFYIFYKVTSFKTMKNRFIQLLAEKKRMPLILGGGGIISIQCLYWYKATSKILIRSYSESETFSWLFPHFIEVLTSISKGLIFYSPVIGISFIGLIVIKNYKLQNLSIISVLLLHLYITCSWDCWDYGGSYGQRPFVDMYCIYALLLGCIFQYFEDIKLNKENGKTVSYLTLVSPLFIIMLWWSLKLMLAYWHGILPFSGATMLDIMNSLQWNFEEMRSLIIPK